MTVEMFARHGKRTGLSGWARAVRGCHLAATKQAVGRGGERSPWGEDTEEAVTSPWASHLHTPIKLTAPWLLCYF